jgi:hypothetical protein
MAESKFTKGPWVAEQVIAANKIHWSIHTENQFIASTGYLGVSLGEQQANAELIADAPRLLEVLDTLYDCIDHEKLLPSQLYAYHRARELLAKHGG